MLKRPAVDKAPARACEGSTHGNLLIYALWVAGGLGLVATLNKGWLSPIGERDFAFFWVAGKLALGGHAAQAYDLPAIKAAATSFGSTIKAPFPYPPYLLLFAGPLSLLPLQVSFFAWEAISAALFYLAARPHVPERMPSWLAVLTPAALCNVAFGQTGLFFGALWLWCFRGSAVAAGLLLIKPHIAVPAAAEVVRKHFLIRTLAIGAAILLLSLAWFGVEPWRAFLRGAATSRFTDIEHGHFVNWYVQMTTPFLGYGFIGWGAFAAAAIGLLLRQFDVFTAGTAAFLISPYGFHYDMTVVCFGFGILLFRDWRSMPPWQTLVCALVFLTPVLVRSGTWLVPPILLLGLYVQTERSSFLAPTRFSDEPTLSGRAGGAVEYSRLS